MKHSLIIILLISTIDLFGQKNEVDKNLLSEINLCELTLGELRNQNADLKEVELIEMDLCADGLVQDARFENRKGYKTENFPGIIFQKDRDTELISKLRLTKEFKGNLPDGTYVDLSDLTAERILEKYPEFNTWISRGCSEYWSLTNKKLYFYVAIDKNKEPRYPIEEKYYLSKPIEGIDIVTNCSEDSKEIQSKPLYIIDGKEISKSEIYKYKPEDIESINVLKDSTAEKYGEKGKNGVIIIKSKAK